MPTSTKTRKKSLKSAPAPLTAKTADRHVLYEIAVQSPDAEMDFVQATFKKLRGRACRSIREDFCGTGHSSCEWVGRGADHTAVGLDLHGPTLAWGKCHNVSKLTQDQRSRLKLLQCNVLDPAPEARGTDSVLAMNFSYFCFATRDLLRSYFRKVRETLGKDCLLYTSPSPRD